MSKSYADTTDKEAVEELKIKINNKEGNKKMGAITTEINILDMPEFKEMVEIIRVIIKDDIVPKVHKDAFDGWFERLRLKRGKGGIVFDGEPAARKICKLIEVAETKAAQYIDGLTASVKEHAAQGHIDANTGQWKYLDPAYVQELSRAKEEWKTIGTLIADLGAAADKIREEAEHIMGHNVHTVKCDTCGHRWTAMWPDGVTIETLECPECHTQGATLSE